MPACNDRRRISSGAFLERQGRRFGIRHAGSLLGPAVDRALYLSSLDRLYRAIPDGLDAGGFAAAVLSAFDIRCDVPAAALARIPAAGATLVVANHPFGAIEGVALAHLLLRVRADVRILANHLLAGIEELQELFIRVDAFGGAGAASRNFAPMRQALRWLQGGGLLLAFPAGTVSHFQFSRIGVADPEWNPAIGRMVHRSRAAVVPVYVHGRNSAWFQMAGVVHPWFRTAMLPREMVNRRGRELRVRVGRAIGYDDLAHLRDEEALTRHLRLHTHLLGAGGDRAGRRTCGRRVGERIIDPLPAGLLAAEIGRLPSAQCLAEAGEMQAWFASADQIPWSLQEIGRLREVTFRSVGEGTGRRCDLDRYDRYYFHLLLWNRIDSKIAGAYRLGLADQILTRFGKHGLYTQSLFRCRATLLHKLMPGIELGRSFVQPDYQRGFTPLLLLWRGIGEFVGRNPQYRFLFGPVSISSGYEPASRRLLVDFLQSRCVDAGLAGGVRPRQPFRRHGGAGWMPDDLDGFRDLDGVDAVLSDLESDRKGAPVLLRHYLKLGGRILGFNVDRHFNDALDALIVVDLAACEPRLLRRYLGADGARRFLDYHARAAGYRMAS